MDQTLGSDTKNNNLSETLQNIQTVGELLIFNTNESAFFEGASKSSHSIKVLKSNKVDTKSVLEAAPSSIVNRDQVLKREDEYLYTPGMGQVCLR